MPKSKTLPLYTPAQTFTATIIGGPAAGAWTFFRNFRATSRDRAAGGALAVGLALCVLVAIFALKYANWLGLYITPAVIPLAYSGAALALAHINFAETVTAQLQSGGRRRSWWNVAGVAIAGLVVVYTVVFLVHKVSPSVDFL
jgi:hypothetical protein